MHIKIVDGKITQSTKFIPNTEYMLKLSNGQILSLAKDIGIKMESNGLVYNDIYYNLDSIKLIKIEDVANHLERPDEVTRVTSVIMDNFWRKSTSFPEPTTIDPSLVFTIAVVKAVKEYSKPRILDKKSSDRLLNDVRNLNACIDSKKEISIIVANRLLNAFGVNLKSLFKENLV